jgi:hypothetical protein
MRWSLRSFSRHGLDESALTEALARERRSVTSRKFFALLRGLASNIDNEEVDPTSSQISDEELIQFIKGLILFERALVQKSPDGEPLYRLVGSTSPVVFACRRMEKRFLPSRREEINDLYRWIDAHKPDNPYTPHGALAYQDCVTLDDRERVDAAKHKKTQAHLRMQAEQKRRAEQRKADEAIQRKRVREERDRRSNEVVIINHGPEGV